MHTQDTQDTLDHNWTCCTTGEVFPIGILCHVRCVGWYQKLCQQHLVQHRPEIMNLADRFGYDRITTAEQFSDAHIDMIEVDYYAYNVLTKIMTMLLSSGVSS